MIKNIRVTGLNQISHLIDAVSKHDEVMYAEILGKVEIAKEYIKMQLKKEFSHHKDEHFFVDIAMTTRKQIRIQISVDEIGSFVYYGTAAHSISSDGPMPIYDGEFFARRVSHPGQESQKEVVQEIVAGAVEIMWMGDASWAF